jgi:hypothetical protein
MVAGFEERGSISTRFKVGRWFAIRHGFGMNVAFKSPHRPFWLGLEKEVIVYL